MVCLFYFSYDKTNFKLPAQGADGYVSRESGGDKITCTPLKGTSDLKFIHVPISDLQKFLHAQGGGAGGGGRESVQEGK